RMIGYDLRTGAARWSVTGTPAGCCASPVAAGGTLFFAGRGSYGPGGKAKQPPPVDSPPRGPGKDRGAGPAPREGGKGPAGALSAEEAEKAFGGYLGDYDTNQDGKLTRDEYDAMVKLYSEGKNSAFAVRAGGTGDVTGSHVLWRQRRGLPSVASAVAYRGQY